MKIAASQGKQNKIHVIIDGEYTFTVDAEYWYSCPYCRVTDIEDSSEQEKFLLDVGSRCAFISGLRILSYGDNSRKDLKIKLRSKGHKAEYVEPALDKLEEYGYLDDKRYAGNLIDRLITAKHMSRGGIKNELIRKGIDRELTDALLEEIDFDPVSSIGELLDTKFSGKFSDEKGLRRTVNDLMRLGYGWSDIKTALNERKETDFE